VYKRQVIKRSVLIELGIMIFNRNESNRYIGSFDTTEAIYKFNKKYQLN